MAKNLIGILRKFRHGPLKKIQPIWSTLGWLFRWSYTKIGSPGTVLQTVGGCGMSEVDGSVVTSLKLSEYILKSKVENNCDVK